MSSFGDLLSSGYVLLALLSVSIVSHFALPHLPAHHRSNETLDLVRLVSSLMVTFSALVLGFLIASVNTAFFTTGNDMNGLAGSLRQTESCLRSYGPATEPIRADLRRYLVGAIASTWPDEPAPNGPAPKMTMSGPNFESLELGRLLEDAQIALLKLDPADQFSKKVQDLCAEQMSKVFDNRWKLIGEAHSSIPAPFYRILVLMLVAVFACFGLSTPRNALSWLTLCVAAATIAASIFVVLELDGPLDGLIKVSSESMRTVLTDFDR